MAYLLITTIIFCCVALILDERSVVSKDKSSREFKAHCAEYGMDSSNLSLQDLQRLHNIALSATAKAMFDVMPIVWPVRSINREEFEKMYPLMEPV